MKLHSILKGLTVACMIGSATLSAPIYAKNNPVPSIKADAPNRYEVKKGDTLWAISGRYLNNPARWREIWATNKQLKNPNLIYPGDVLIMCVIKGKTLVGVDTGEGCAGIERNMQAPKPNAPIKLNPTEGSIGTIPLANIRHWLDRSVIVNPILFEQTPHVLASKNGNLVTGVGDVIYVRGAPLVLGDTYGIYRKTEPYIDPATKAVVGLETVQVAKGRVVNVAANGVSSIQITHNYDSEIREGDRVFAEIDAHLPSAFYPVPAEVTRGGTVVRVVGGISKGAKDSVIAINLGAVQGAKAGHVLDVYRKGALVKDVYDKNTPVRLPSEKAATAMIFKVFDNISYAYILDAELPIDVGDQLLPAED